MDRVVPWRQLCALIAPVYPNSGKGRTPGTARGDPGFRAERAGFHQPTVSSSRGGGHGAAGAQSHEVEGPGQGRTRLRGDRAGLRLQQGPLSGAGQERAPAVRDLRAGKPARVRQRRRPLGPLANLPVPPGLFRLARSATADPPALEWIVFGNALDDEAVMQRAWARATAMGLGPSRRPFPIRRTEYLHPDGTAGLAPTSWRADHVLWPFSPSRPCHLVFPAPLRLLKKKRLITAPTLPDLVEHAPAASPPSPGQETPSLERRPLGTGGRSTSCAIPARKNRKSNGTASPVPSRCHTAPARSGPCSPPWPGPISAREPSSASARC